ncbi:MAG: hypothetical protein SPJ17_07820 [Anaeroplasma sp.]|uniref:hypothetical protein n=1 Tax=Anaeroplasma sp. TaxID=1872523 RepID=UPI002A90CB0C|nr:hypothetical protein [Anaeroplasma sp.]MDY5983592.1 hypothetical protein [Anaeroplasma sp.]
MKTKVIVSADTGIEAIPMASIVSYLPSRICFSDCESYDSLLNMDFHQFNLRMKYDSLANPEIKGCKEEKLKEILDDLAKDGYERFYFILSNQKISYYKPLIEKYIHENKKVQSFYFQVKSEGFPVVYMAYEAQKLFELNKSIPEIEKMLSFLDANNTMYFFSLGEDKIPKIEKLIDSSLDPFEFENKNVVLHILKKNESSIVRLKEKNKTIAPYVDVFLLEMDGKKVIPFILYTNRFSKYTESLLKELEKSFPDMEIPIYEMPPYLSLKYGKFSCAIGYIVRYGK